MFNYFKPKLVEFGNGKFGILKNRLFGGPCYLGNDLTWWSLELYIEKYCFFESAEVALDAYAREIVAKNRFKTKVITTLDVDEWDVV